jgi:GTPase SAR1 family protein
MDEKLPETEDKVEIKTGDVKVEKGGILNIAGHDIIQNIFNFFQGDTEQQRAYRNRQNMLQLVWNTWIEGVLKQSLHHEVLIELGMETRPNALERPWDLARQIPDREPRPIEPGTTMLDLFDQATGSLLILGEPGSGKTTMLLELCRLAIERAKEDPIQPIPVVFNLSAWKPESKKEPEQAFLDWLVGELRDKYSIPKKIGYPWIEHDALLLLLDGLDEVEPQNRERCVQTINRFREQHYVNLLVCTRRQEYECLEERLKLSEALLIQPLTKNQVDAYFQGFPVERTITIQDWIKADPTIYEFIRTPLILSLFLLTSKIIARENQEVPGSVNDFRNRLFDEYIGMMFRRRGENQGFTLDQTKNWLAWLAVYMTRNSQSIFYKENLNAAWFKSVAGKKIIWDRFRLIMGLLYGLLLFSYSSLIFVSGMNKSFIEFVLICPSMSLLGFFMGIFTIDKDHPKPIDKIGWSLRVLRPRIKGLFFGSIAIAIVFGLILFFMGNVFLYGLVIIPFALPVLFLVGGFTSSEVEKRAEPGQGMQYSLRNGVIVNLFMTLVSGIILRVVMGPAGLYFGLGIGFIMGQSYGGFFYIYNKILCWILYKFGIYPDNDVDFFNFATNLTFFHKVGGGYIFIHRMLMEHFAAMWEEQIRTE